MLNKALLIEQLKRFWAISVLATLVYLLAVYAPMVSEPDAWRAMRRLIDIITMRNEIMIFTLLLTPLLAAFCTFGFLFNKKKATAFYTLPISKSQLFATNALAGIILSLIPLIIFSIVLLLPLGFHDDIAQAWRNHALSFPDANPINLQEQIPATILPSGVTEGAPINVPSVIGGFFLRMALATLFYFAMFMLAFTLAGNGIVGLLVAGVKPLIPIGLFYIVSLTGAFFVFGHGTGLFGNWILASMVMAYFNPVFWGDVMRDPIFFTRTEAVIIPYILYILMTAGMFASGFVLSHRRKPERTGDSIVFRPVKNVLIFLVSFAIMLIVAVIMYSATESIAVMYIGAVVGFVLGYVVAQMIAEKSIYVMHKMKYLLHFGGVVVGLYVFVFAFTQFGMGFYVNHIPDRDQIYGIRVDEGAHRLMGDLELRRRAFVTDSDSIDAAVQAHQTILDNRRYLHRAPNTNLDSYRRFVNGVLQMRERVTIQYMLLDGQIITRNYVLPISFVESSGIYTFLDSEARVLTQNSLLMMPDVLHSWEFSFSVLTYTIDAHGERHWRDSNPVRVIVSDPEQMVIVSDLLLQGLVASAAEFRTQIHDPSIWRGTTTSFELNVGAWPREDLAHQRAHPIGSWRGLHFGGVYAEKLLDQLAEWGLVLEHDIETLHELMNMESDEFVFQTTH
ncbi:MAG: hypothetical protein FWC89_08435 [Defluviitaleaceae bacterium]|nr:hypothetical protein [Defluviitaleaceae bacterium]